MEQDSHTGSAGRPARTIGSPAALVESIRSQHTAGHRRLIGVVGPPGAGKSHLARNLGSELADRSVAIVPMDGFHLANVVLEGTSLRGHKGRPDTFDVGGFVSLLDRLRARDEDVVYAPRFDREIEEAIASAIPVPADVHLVIVEGNYLLLDRPPWDAVAPRLDATYYLDVPESVRTERLLARARQTYGERGDAWVATVDRPNSAIVESSKHRADFIVTHFDLDGEG